MLLIIFTCTSTHQTEKGAVYSTSTHQTERGAVYSDMLRLLSNE